MFKVLFLGEIVGLPVVKALRKKLPGVILEFRPDMVIGNADGASDGYGVLAETAQELLEAGFDLLTGGDLIYNKRNIKEYLEHGKLLRPDNLPDDSPGSGYMIHELPNGVKVAVVSLLGRTNFNKIFAGDPYCAHEKRITQIRQITPNILVDFHGGTTSEIQSMHWLLAGQVSAVVGTHARVQTADHRILEGHTAVITGLGICGGLYSIAGFSPDIEIIKIKSGRFSYSKIEKEQLQIQGVLLEIDETSGKAVSIQLIHESLGSF